VSDVRPERHALLELDALLGEIAALRDDGDAARFDRDSRYRWVLHRLWIAVGNEALARRSPHSLAATIAFPCGNHRLPLTIITSRYGHQQPVPVLRPTRPSLLAWRVAHSRACR